MKYLCLVYLEPGKWNAVPDRECLGCGEELRASGPYGPKVTVPADADEQTRLIAFTGRQP